MTPHKRWSLLIALPLVVLALTGCELRADVLVAVDVDGGGTLAVTLTADDELARTARDAGADPLTALADAGRQLPGWRVDRPQGDPGTVTLETTFADADELERISAQFAEAVAAPELRPLEPLRLTVADDTVELRGGAGLQVTSAVREIGYSRARARRVLADSVQLRVTARMPGEVLETNARERADDRTVTWTVPPGEQRRLRVLAARPWTVRRILNRLVWPAGALALVIALVVIVARRRATRRASTSSARAGIRR